MKVWIKELKDIKPYYNNPRDNANAVPPVIESIKRFGFIKPIVCDSQGVIIAGHTRYIAAFQMGLTQVPVVYSDMSEEDAKLFRIADNKLAEKSSFDEDMLVEELRKLSVPKEMQAFFFEDIDSMLNFSANDFQAADFDPSNMVDTNSYEAPSEESADYGGFESQNDSETPINNDSEAAFEPTEAEEQQEVGDSEPPIYQPYQKDGKVYMRVVCPYCGNIETIELN